MPSSIDRKSSCEADLNRPRWSSRRLANRVAARHNGDVHITRETCDNLVKQLTSMIDNGCRYDLEAAHDAVADGTALDILRKAFPDELNDHQLVGTRWLEMNEALVDHANDARDTASATPDGDGLALIRDAAMRVRAALPRTLPY